MSTDRKHLTQEEIARLFKVIDSPRDRAIFRLAYHRGLRASEVGMLQMSDLRMDRGRLYVRRLKGRVTNMSGEYILTDEEIRMLKSWLRERGDEPGPLFTSNRKTGISRKMLDYLMKQYSRLAKIPSKKPERLNHFHVLRHSCATHMLERGEGVGYVQDHLGHVNIANTMVYARITNKLRDEAAKRLKDWK